jgi:putative transposase
MPTGHRPELEGPTLFFLTTSLRNHERLFATQEVCDEVSEAMFRVAMNTKTTIMAYCIMPSHIHIIAGHAAGGGGISRFMQSFKSLVSHAMFGERHGIWIPRFDDVIIASERVFLSKLNYIHDNPVRAGLVANATDWRWSSARFWYLDEPSAGLSKTFECSWDGSKPGRGRPGCTPDVERLAWASRVPAR